MPTELTSAGYQDIRQRVAGAWTHIGIREGSTEHFRLPATDPRVTVSDGTTNPVRVTVVLAGDDTEIDGGPLTVDNTALYSQGSGGSILSQDSFTPFVFGAEEDELTITHDVQIPEIP